ncbi:MAG: serine/threonine protein kinase [Deltaproteobacteria bacterium]|nr:serine/threonine protein kinase [Deltaproteobacteria bacterium]
MATCPKCRTHHSNDVKTCPTDGSALLDDAAFDSADKELTAGQMVGEYQIEGKLGEGGFGVVFRAVHPLIGKPAAIKVLNRQFSSDPQMVSRFISEARSVNQIRHRNIIDIFAFGRLEDGRQYYVMELLEGTTLDAYVHGKGKLPPAEAVGVLRQVARALDAAHAHGIAHRDLKPENIFLTFDDDGAPFPKLLDFGIAKLMGEAGAAHKTRTGVPIGTPYYMSPEQCRGVNVDHRTDIYSFGIVAFEILTGKLPFSGDTVMDVLLKQATMAPPRASSVAAELPAAMDEPLLAMLDKDPDKRPASVGAAVDALAAAAGIAVPQRVAPTFDKSAPVRVVTDGKMTPADMSALAEAGTMQGMPTPSVAFATTTAPRRSRARLYAAAAIGAVALTAVVVTALLLRSNASATLPAAAPSQSVAVQKVAESASATPTAVQTPPQIAAATDVAFTVQSVPADVEIFLGDEKLGTSPGPISVRKGTDKIKLTFKAKGYKSSELEVAPTADGVLSVTLQKAVAAGKTQKRTGGGELENPF